MNAESDERAETAIPAVAVPVTGDVTTGVNGSVAGGEASAEPPLGSRAPEFIKARRTLHISWQVGVFIVGLAVVGAGIVMLPLPGPGWLVIFAGMAIWATEFVWAQLVLRWTKRKVTEAAQRALDPKVRRRNIILTTIGLVIVAVLVGIYVAKFGIVMPWKIAE
ncbi:TIGR02611 family protein [Streptomyces sp. NPDC000410]|uniref:TIGR02611 family protein n=1 Tax=Streptomyces sp. NPDC000410 TaxID=3154254 RepID=UPI003323397F